MQIENHEIQIVQNNFELNILKQKNIPYEILIPDLESSIEQKLLSSVKNDISLQDSSAFKLGSMSGYFTLGEIYDFFDALSLKHPGLLSERIEVGISSENRPILCYKLGNLKNDSLPKILITALHHSREPLCLMSLGYFVNDILTKYNSENQDARSILDNNLIYIVPVVNPDGYIFNQTRYPSGGGLWRKNRTKLNDSTFGVDINRNYGPYDYWNSQNLGSSTEMKTETYRGKAPFSEPETQAVKNLCETIQFKIALNLHSFGNLLLYPNSALTNETKDSLLYRGISRYLSSRNLFCFGRDLQTVGYPSRGTSDDWMYLETTDKKKILAFTAEIGTPADFFWPTRDKIIPYCQDNLQLYYEFLKNCYSNLVPLDYQGYYVFESKSYRLNIRFQNIGLRKIESKCVINLEPLNNDVEIFNPVRNVTGLNSSDIHSENFIIKRKNFAVAESERFRISIQNEKYLFEDTLSFIIDNYDSINVFDRGVLQGNWNMGEWGLEFIDDLKEFVLSDSPKGFYKNASENYIQLLSPIKIISKKAVLEFVTRWSTEANRDACVVQISTDNGSTWNQLRTQRMIIGDGADKSKFLNGLFGLHGTFVDWNLQSANLEDFYGEDVLLRFGVLSDLSKNFDGWFLRNIKIKLYQNINWIENTTGEKYSVFPNTVYSIDKKIEIESHVEQDFNCRIFDYIGLEYHLPVLSKGTSKLVLDAQRLSSGIYLLVLEYQGLTNVLKVIILN